MEGRPHCMVHRESLAEYMCPACGYRPLCETCRRDHETATRHAPENCKEVGLAIMNQFIQDGILANELDKGLIKIAKGFEVWLQREIDRLQESCVQNEERCSKMWKLDNERRYAELYRYAKSLAAGGAKSKTATGELSKHLLEMFDKASKEFKRALNEIAPAVKHKPVFSAYKKDEVLVFEDESYAGEEQMVSDLKTADMSTTKVKAVYINRCDFVGDSVASELASRLQTHPVSAIYLAGYNISGAGAGALAKAAFRNRSLSAFCIGCENISDAGAKAVAQGARNSRSLTTLYLYGQEISDFGAIMVAEAVRGCPLSAFYLAGGCISDSGAIAVAKAVKSCPLSAFCFWSGEISDSGAIAVAKTVKDCQLSAFYLVGNKISDAGATAAAEIISSGRCADTLSAFYLGGGSIFDSGAKKVADAVRGCPLLSSLYIDSNPISGETVAYILEGMADISSIRSVNLYIGEISKEQIDACLDRLQQSGVAKQLKLRFECETEAAVSVCNKFISEWDAKFAECCIVPQLAFLFAKEVILGEPN